MQYSSFQARSGEFDVISRDMRPGLFSVRCRQPDKIEKSSLSNWNEQIVRSVDLRNQRRSSAQKFLERFTKVRALSNIGVVAANSCNRKQEQPVRFWQAYTQESRLVDQGKSFMKVLEVQLNTSIDRSYRWEEVGFKGFEDRSAARAKLYEVSLDDPMGLGSQ